MWFLPSGNDQIESEQDPRQVHGLKLSAEPEIDHRFFV